MDDAEIKYVKSMLNSTTNRVGKALKKHTVGMLSEKEVGNVLGVPNDHDLFALVRTVDGLRLASKNADSKEKSTVVLDGTDLDGSVLVYRKYCELRRADVDRAMREEYYAKYTATLLLDDLKVRLPQSYARNIAPHQPEHAAPGVASLDLLHGCWNITFTANDAPLHLLRKAKADVGMRGRQVITVFLTYSEDYRFECSEFDQIKRDDSAAPGRDEDDE